MKLSSHNLAFSVLAAVIYAGVGGFCLAIEWYTTAIILFFLSLLFTVRGIWLHKKNLNKVTFMFNSIENDDFNFKFAEQKGPTSEILFNAALNRIKDIMAKTKAEITERERFYELILESVATGVIIADREGRIYQVNGSALKLFGVGRLTHLRQLKHIDEIFLERLLCAQAGSRLQFQVNNERGIADLSVTVSDVQVRGQDLRILALSDIRGELDEKEIESWIRLIRVLTHEIMNSITPITSLSDTLTTLVREEDTDLRKGLETISSTGKALVCFVESYRKITRIPDPQRAPFPVSSLLERIIQLNPSEKISVFTHTEPELLEGFGDEKLLAQVLMNLVKNSMEALRNTPDGKIDIIARKSPTGKTTITIADNGPGISPETAQQIFVPFFTTKEGGTGIGLSISRQILRRHEGNIRIIPSGKGAVFELEF